MEEQFSRTALLLGQDAVNRLGGAHVAVFGAGGVGSYAIEALARCGVGRFTIVDGDCVEITNLNRQLFALHSTLGKLKALVAADRIRDINPDAQVDAIPVFFTEETADSFDFSTFDYVVDAVDMISAKLLLVERASAAGTKIISAMGAGNKLDPSRFEVADIFETSVCPLAKVMRRELRARGITALKVVYSREEAIRPEQAPGGRRVVGSLPFVPSAAGLLIAAKVVRDLMEMSI